MMSDHYVERLPTHLVGVSFKMYFSLSETLSYATALSTSYSRGKGTFPKCGIFIIPSFPALVDVTRILSPESGIQVGAQNCHWENFGSYTGEVSPAMLKEIGCAIVEVGHAERRKPPFNETDQLIALKAQLIIRNGMVPLVCIGEKTKSGILSEGVGLAIRECVPQIAEVLSNIPPSAAVIFAYEPVWAIGGQEPAIADHVLAVVGELRRHIEARGRKGHVRILYGGSAQPGTWNQLKNGVDGLFLGRFAHGVGAFKSVVDEVGKDA